jgi:ATP-binding protein involved in chromosome partitioning
MRHFRTYNEVDDPAGAEVLEQVVEQRRRLAERLAGVRHVVVVASGKGGVGKSALTANLAAALAARGRRVGVVDADLNGPSLARMLGVRATPLLVTDDGITPLGGVAGVRLASLELLLEADDSPLRWRGPSGDDFIWRGTLEMGALRELLADFNWGELDYLLVDLPPGTDRIERLLSLVPRPSALILVSTPSAAAVHVVARSARWLREASVPNVGLVVNMSRYACPGCGESVPLFEGDDVGRLVEDAGLPVWMEIPFDPGLAGATDTGRPWVLGHAGTPAGSALLRLADQIEERSPA